MNKAKILILLFSALVLSQATAFGQTRVLDGYWDFCVDPYNIGKEKEWYNNSFDTKGWDKVKVPGNWNTTLKYSDYTGVTWYRTVFEYENNPSVSDLILNFEAVYNGAEVWLNGKLLGSHNFGFTSFDFNINDCINKDKPNILVVRVDNSFKIGATWNWGGIRRSVSLVQLPKNRISHIYITPELNLKKSTATVTTKTLLTNSREAIIKTVIKDANNKVVAQKTAKVSPNESEKQISLILKNVNKWDFDSPYLYKMTVSLEESGKTIHSVTERFGVRKIEIDGYKLLLNGKNIRLNGANYVPDDRFSGNTLPEDKFKRDIDQMKECGVNMARLSHMPLPKDVLDYIDEKGILIFEEIPLWNKNEYVKANHPTPKQWLTELILQRYNHPSIIGWSAGNEIGRLSDNPDIEGYLSSAFKHIKSLDSTRFAVYVTHTAAKQDNEPVLLSDIIMFNQYGAHGERADVVNKQYPGKPIFYSEYGTKINGEDLNNNNIDFASMLESMRQREYLIGASVWTFNDYRSNYKDNSTLATQNRPWGVVDAYGQPKRGYKILQEQYSPLKKLDVNILYANNDASVNISIHPRSPLDLPAYEMANYHIKVNGLDKNNHPIASNRILLPTIIPGDKPSNFVSKIKIDNVEKINVDLISPLGYNIYSTSYYLHQPSAPKIEYTESAQSAIRIYFEGHPSATEWYVKYGWNELDTETKPTINHFIDLEGLDFHKEYKIQLIAVNNAGKTTAKDIITAKTIAAELPPIVCHLLQKDENIQIAYSCSNDDFIYDFQYGLSPDNLEKHIQTTVTGACNLPVIKENADHYLRIRKRSRYGYESQWSRIIKTNGKYEKR